MSRKQKRQRQRIHLEPTDKLPEGYKHRQTFTLGLENWRRLVTLNLIGAVLFFVFGWSFLDTALRLRPELGDEIVNVARGSAPVLIGGNLAGAIILIIGHELVHGLFFYYYTRARPRFGFKIFYAYAAAPGWYLPRTQYMIVALAPFVLLTALGAILIGIIPLMMAPAFLFGLIMNAAGSVGDFAVVVWLLRQPGKILIEDVGEAVNIYAP